MNTIQRHQRPGEGVEECVADCRTKMQTFGYNNALQMTLVLNGLRPDIKAIAMQHLPFENFDVLLTKAKHIEAALKSYDAVASAQVPSLVPSPSASILPQTPSPSLAANMTTRDHMQEVEEAIQRDIAPLDGKLMSIHRQMDNTNHFSGRQANPATPSPPQIRERAPQQYRNGSATTRCFAKVVCIFNVIARIHAPEMLATPSTQTGVGTNKDIEIMILVIALETSQTRETNISLF